MSHPFNQSDRRSIMENILGVIFSLAILLLAYILYSFIANRLTQEQSITTPTESVVTDEILEVSQLETEVKPAEEVVAESVVEKPKEILVVKAAKPKKTKVIEPKKEKTTKTSKAPVTKAKQTANAKSKKKSDNT